jgi:hypothetical protein
MRNVTASLSGVVLLAAAACVPAPHDAKLSITLVRGDDDPLMDPGNAAHGASSVGSIEVDLTVGMQMLMQTVEVGASKSLSVREVPTSISGEGSLLLLGRRSDDGNIYSAARSPRFTLDGGAVALDLFFGPGDALTPAGESVPQPRSALALAPLGNIGAVLLGGDTDFDGGFVPADPALLVFRSTEARLCGFDAGCLSGDEPEPRSGAIAAALPSGSVVHGLGRLADGGLDSTLFLTDPDGTTQRLALTGDPLPGLANAAAVALKDGILMIAGGEGASATSDAIFHVDVEHGQVTLQMNRLAHARSHVGVSLLSLGSVVLVGGTSTTSGPLDTVEVYTPGGRSQLIDGGGFTGVRTNMHSARVDPAVARLPDNSVAIFGGGSLYCELFQDVLGTVGGLVDMTAPTDFHFVSPAAARLVTGDLLVTGGEVAGGNPICAVFSPTPGPQLDVNNSVYLGTWRRCTGAGLNARARAGAVVLPDQSVLIVGGGIGGEPFNPGMPSANRVEVYEPIPH